jgi:ATP-dependent DNA helicase DinG
MSPAEQKQLDKLAIFGETSSEGSLSDISFPLLPGLWSKVCAERSSCSHVECPHFKRCFFFKARRQLEESQILIVNHHLLVAEVAARMRPDFQEEKSILPKFSRFVLDEAHHLEEIALESFSVRLDRLELVRYLGRIYSDNQPHKSRLLLLKETFASKRKKISPELLLLFDVDIPGKKREAVEHLEELLHDIQIFCSQEFVCENSPEGRERRWKLSFDAAKLQKWEEEIIEKFLALSLEWKRLLFLLSSLKKAIQQDLSTEDKESFSSHFISLDIIERNLAHKLDQLEKFVCDPSADKRVRWVELSPPLAMDNITLIDAQLNVSKHLREHLFSSKETAVLCSATLASNRSFNFLKKQIGLESEQFATRVSEKIFDSPFDFKNNALFLVPNDVPFPHEQNFIQESCAIIKKVIHSSRGGCFLLFTSYDMLQKCYDLITSSSDCPPGHYLRQGMASRHELIDRFKARKDGILFATSSFWEGVDVSGEALRCVILVKLPFKVPSEPFFQAMSEMVEKEGKDPFTEYSLPLASLRFKQGFGRLIRSQYDRGCVVCLDKRVIVKPYGKVFLKGLPDCPVHYESTSKITQKLDAFYAFGA